MRHLLPALFLFFSSLAAADIDLTPQGFVNDYAGVLSQAEVASIEEKIRAVERTTGTEIAVAVVKDLGGRNLEQYAHEVFNAWGVGKKGKDNGVLIFVSIRERKIRIETGYGLEAVLPDGVCGHIIRNEMTPRFRSGDIAGGLESAVSAIGRIVGGAPAEQPAPSGSADLPPAGFIAFWTTFLLIFTGTGFGLAGLLAQLCLIVFLFLGFFLTSGQPFSAPFLAALLFAPFITVFLLAFVYQILAALGVISRRRSSLWTGTMMAQSSRLGSSGGFFGGGGVGGFGGGFGGGRSGGGGASGGW